MISNLVVKYISVINVIKYPLLLIWIIVTAISGYWMFQFPTDTKGTLDPPPASLSAEAKQKYDEVFPSPTQAMYYFIEATGTGKYATLHDPDLDSYEDDSFYRLDRAITWWVMTGNLTTNATWEETNLDAFGPKGRLNGQGKEGYTWSSYWFTLWATFPEWIAARKLGPGYRSGKVEVTWEGTDPTNKTVMAWVTELEDAIKVLKTELGYDGLVELHGFGVATFGSAIAESVFADLFIMFGIAVPIAALIYAFSLSCIRYLIILFISLLANVLISFALLDGIAKNALVNSLTPGIAAAFGLALTTDYSYFIMCKYRKQVRNLGEVRKEHCVPLLELVLSSAGRTIFCSSFIIMACAFPMLFLEVNMYASVGYCAVLCPLTAVLVSLNLIPCILCIEPTFWMQGAMPYCSDKVENEKDPHISGYFAPLFLDVETVPDKEDFGDATADQNRSEGASTRLIDGEANRSQRASRKANMLDSVRSEDEMNSNRSFTPQNGLSAGGGELPKNGSSGALASEVNAHRSISVRAPRYSTALSVRSRANTVMSVATHVTKTTVDLHHEHSRHFRLVSYITRFPNSYCIMFLTILIAIFPIVIAFTHMNISNDIVEFIPRGTGSTASWKRFEIDFGAGDAFPYFWLMDTGDAPFPSPALEDNKQGQSLGLLNILTKPYPKTNSTEFPLGPIDTRMQTKVAGMLKDFLAEMGPRFGLEGKHVSNIFYDAIAEKSHPTWVNPDWWYTAYCIRLTALAGFGLVSKEQTPGHCSYGVFLLNFFQPLNTKIPFNGTFAFITTPFNPASREGIRFYQAWRDWKDTAERNNNVTKSWIVGYGAETDDNVEYSKEHFPPVVAVATVILFAIVTLMFGSPVVALRATLTVALGVTAAFGFVNMVFVLKIFNWIGFTGLTGSGQVAWPIPFSCFLVSVGISLNYNLISTIRVLEFYWLGVPPTKAVIYGIADSGREITVAAVMMMIIFLGMLLSKVAALAQLGLYLYATAMFSGLFFRLFLTPPLMVILGDWNFWGVRAWCIAPLVLPGDAKKAQGAYSGIDFDAEEAAAAEEAIGEYTAPRAGSEQELYQESRTGTNAGGPVYRNSTVPAPSSYGTTPTEGVDGSSM